MRDHQRAVKFDPHLLAAAETHYEQAGYAPTAVPWVVGQEAYNLTRPQDAAPYETLGGFLVGSAEQSFYQLLLRGEKLGKVQAISPCFRDENHDELHHPYFMKLELMEAHEPNEEKLELMIATAQSFMARYIDVAREVTDEGIDLVARDSGIEVGSYGFRCVGAHAWIYGTGLALPRFTQARIKQENR